MPKYRFISMTETQEIDMPRPLSASKINELERKGWAVEGVDVVLPGMEEKIQAFQPEDVLPIAGAIIGGIAGGATLTPFGATVGTGGGAFAGESLRGGIRSIRQTLTPSQEQVVTPGEILKSAGSEAALAAGTELGTAGLIKGARLGYRVLRGAQKPITGSVREIAEREGINLPLSARTEEPSLLGLEEMISRTPAGGTLVKAHEEATKQLEKFTERVGARYVTSKLTQEELGVGMKQGFDTLIKSKNAYSNALYNELDEVAGNVKASTSSDTFEFIEELFNKEGINYNPRTKRISADLKTTDVKSFKPIVDVLEDLKNPDLTYTDLKKIRTAISKRAEFEDVKAHGMEATYKKLYSTLTEDMDRTATEGGFGRLADEAKSFYRDFMNFLDSPLAKKMNTDNPSLLVNKLVESNNPKLVRQIVDEFDGASQNYLKKQFLDSLIDKSFVEKVPGATISVGKFANNINKYSDETLSELFGDDFKQIIDIRTLANLLKRSEVTGFGSPTYIGLSNLFERLMARLGVAKFISSEIGKQVLTEAIPRLPYVTEEALRSGAQIGRGYLQNRTTQ